MLERVKDTITKHKTVLLMILCLLLASIAVAPRMGRVD